MEIEKQLVDLVFRALATMYDYHKDEFPDNCNTLEIKANCNDGNTYTLKFTREE